MLRGSPSVTTRHRQYHHQLPCLPDSPMRQVRFDAAVEFDRPKTARRRLSTAPTMTTDVFKEFQAPDMPDTVLAGAAGLFSGHYGVWNTPDGRPGGKPGG